MTGRFPRRGRGTQYQAFMEPMDNPRVASFATGTGLFVRTLAVAHAVAFASFWVQERGLIGPEGILPAGQFLAAAKEQLGRRAWFDVPSLCWLFGTGAFVDLLCALGIVLALLLFLGIAGSLPCSPLGVLPVALIGGPDLLRFPMGFPPPGEHAGGHFSGAVDTQEGERLL